MQPEFQIQAVKLHAQQRQGRPVKFVPPKPSSPQTRKSRNCNQMINYLASQQKNIKVKTSADKLTRKSSIDHIQLESIPQPQIEQIQIEPQQKINNTINMDERYLYYQNEAKKREYLVEICDGVTFYKPIKIEDQPKPPKPKQKTKQINQNLKESQEQQSVLSQRQTEQTEKSISSIVNEDLDEIPSVEHKPVDPNFLIQGSVDGYQLDESQSQMFSYGLNDYVSDNNRNHSFADRDILEEMKPKHEQVFGYYDYYPPDIQNGQIPKPLLESVNAMNYLKQQQELQEQQQQN